METAINNSSNQSNIKVSVTVPLYNAEKYLRQCLDSLAAQTLKEIEFILVDDGSTDNSGEICDEYASKDNRFKVIHQENGGSAAARQTGLDASTGEYIIVCDSDDWVEPYMYEKLYTKAKETGADIVCCGYFAEYNDGKSIPNSYKFQHLDGVDFKLELFKYGHHMSWNKLMRKNLLTDVSGGCYVFGINLGEDAFALMRILKTHNPKVAQIENHLYHYRRLLGKQSYTNCVRMNNIKQNQYIYDWFKENYSEKIYSEAVSQKAINLAFTMLRAEDLDKEYLKAFLKAEISWSRLKFTLLNLKAIMVYGCKLLPLNFSLKIYKNLYQYFYK